MLLSFSLFAVNGRGLSTWARTASMPRASNLTVVDPAFLCVVHGYALTRPRPRPLTHNFTFSALRYQRTLTEPVQHPRTGMQTVMLIDLVLQDSGMKSETNRIRIFAVRQFFSFFY